MNTTEHLVELYYRETGCFTATDIKIVKGNNRQIDLLAYSYTTKKLYHVEISVAHGIHWQGTLENLKDRIRYKFFGAPRNSRPTNNKTDFAKGKDYREQIKDTYSKFGVNDSDIIRVWCTWCLPKSITQADIDTWKESLATEFNLSAESFDLLLFRDKVLPTLYEKVGTAYYDDEILRTLSLMKEYTRQTAPKNN